MALRGDAAPTEAVIVRAQQIDCGLTVAIAQADGPDARTAFGI